MSSRDAIFLLVVMSALVVGLWLLIPLFDLIDRM